MDDVNKVAKPEEKVTPPQETTPVETTPQPTPEKVGAGDKKPEETERFDKHPRFQELNERVKKAEADLAERKREDAEKQLQEIQKPPKTPQDPYAGMSSEDEKQTRAFVDNYVKPEVRKEYEPFIQAFKQQMNERQVNEAVEFSKQYGIDFNQKLPEIINYLSRPENKGRLNATEAVRNLYFDQITGSVKTKTQEELQKDTEELNQKKKLANTPTSSVAPSSVIQSDEMARQQIPKAKRTALDVQEALKLVKAGVKNPKVRSTSGDAVSPL